MDSKTLIDKLAKKLNAPPTTVNTLIEGLAKCLGDCAMEGDTVTLQGFGNFETHRRLERVAVHPASGKRLLVPPKIVLTFKPSSTLKQRVNNGE